MKKVVLSLLLMVSSLGFSQVLFPESSAPVFDKKHEVRISALRAITGYSLELSYEYIANKDFSYGGHVEYLTGLEKPSGFGVTPFFRMYFTSSKEYGAKGFFGEPMLGLYNTNVYYYNYEKGDSFEKSKFALAPGVAIGWKYVNRSGFVLELKTGVMKNLLENGNSLDGYYHDNINFMFRGDIGLGYRF